MKHLRFWQAGLLVAVFASWHLLTTPGLLPNFMFENDRQAAFFFGEPVKIFGRIWNWFVANADQSVALAIQEVTEDGGVGTYAFANNTQPSRHWTWRFRRHDGNELRGTIGNGPATLTTRLRRDGAMDVLWQNGDAWASGVLTRMTPIFA